MFSLSSLLRISSRHQDAQQSGHLASRAHSYTCLIVVTTAQCACRPLSATFNLDDVYLVIHCPKAGNICVGLRSRFCNKDYIAVVLCAE
jgi:hypothetical protein